MNVEERIEKMWDAVDKIRDNTTRIEIAVAQHCGQQDIHARPPCEGLRALSGKIWAIGFAAFAAMLSALISLMKDKLF